MIKILGTTGTSNFPELVKELDILGKKGWNINCQIANIDYTPMHIDFFRFSDNIEALYLSHDVIVCHAGQGTIYSLLEMGKRIIVVPNSNFKDNHQRDLCRFVEINNFGFVAWDITNIKHLLTSIIDHKFVKYENTNHDLIQSIVNIIKFGEV